MKRSAGNPVVFVTSCLRSFIVEFRGTVRVRGWPRGGWMITSKFVHDGALRAEGGGGGKGIEDFSVGVWGRGFVALSGGLGRGLGGGGGVQRLGVGKGMVCWDLRSLRSV